MPADREPGEAVACSAGGRDGHLGQELAFPDGGHVDADEEVVGCHGSLAVGSANRERGVERDEQRRQMVGRVGDTNVPADGTAISYLDVSDRRHDLGQDRTCDLDL
jgi:hypothetical protein